MTDRAQHQSEAPQPELSDAELLARYDRARGFFVACDGGMFEVFSAADALAKRLRAAQSESSETLAASRVGDAMRLPGSAAPSAPLSPEDEDGAIAAAKQAFASSPFGALDTRTYERAARAMLPWLRRLAAVQPAPPSAEALARHALTRFRTGYSDKRQAHGKQAHCRCRWVSEVEPDVPAAYLTWARHALEASRG